MHRGYYINRTTTARKDLNVNVVFANGLLIVKQYSSSEELSFCNKLTVKLGDFDLQAAAKCPSLPLFRQASNFVTEHLFAKCVELPQ